MKAAVFKAYGGPEQVYIEERPTPIPNDNEVQIRVMTTSVNSADWRIRSLNVPTGFGIIVRLFFGLFRPRQQVLGSELAGVIERTGKHVTRFQPGDEVIAMTGVQLGAHAEYVVLIEDALIVKKPENLNWEQAASFCFGGTTTLDFLFHKGKLKAGEHVLINGASGTVGTAAIQLAKHAGATVTAVCSFRATQLMRALGADHVINYETEDFRDYPQRWDVILDVVGNARWKESKHAMKPNGRLLRVVADMKDTLLSFTHKDNKGRHEITGTAREDIEDVKTLARLAQNDEFNPVVHKTFELSDIREAHRAIEKPGKHGSLVIRVSHES
jgi:NADPH:quinone reductase-like Zn-dependent oxidoreductase